MQAQKTIDRLPKLFHVCMVLMLFFFAASIILGISNKKLALDIEVLEIFLLSAAEVKPNFEESLNFYTEGAQDAIDYVQTLRPDSEGEYIDFISSVEGIGQNLALDVNLESLDTPKPDNLGSVLRYRVEFFGSRNDLIAFLKELEALPYYVRVETLQYKSLEFAVGPQGQLAQNVVLTLQLYVR
jgi:hypothetical protein